MKENAAEHPKHTWFYKIAQPLHQRRPPYRAIPLTHPTLAESVVTRSQHGRYMPGLDGLRALSVLAVIAYHLGIGFVPGGLLGVDVFFVLSGYLITDLLIAQWQTEGRIDLKAFWMRRARRLLPGLWVMLVTVAAWLLVTSPATLAGLRGDFLAAALYVSNWWLIFHHVSYFAAYGPPSPLAHLWSLAVEEQFYLLWPVVLILLLRYIRRRGWLLALIVTAAALSAWLMALLYQPGGNPNRVYYGTDTRAFSLLIGAALAVVWASRRLNKDLSKARRIALDVCGALALAAVLFMLLTTNEYETFMYRGGMVLVSVASAAVIAVLAHPASRIAWLLGQQPLRWLGLRSYGLYLWHYPVIVLTTPSVNTGGFDVTRACLQVGASIILADLSWRFVEMPIRRGALGRLWAQAARPNPLVQQSPRRTRILAFTSIFAGALLFGGLIADVLHTTTTVSAASGSTPYPSAAKQPVHSSSQDGHKGGTTLALHLHHPTIAQLASTEDGYTRATLVSRLPSLLWPTVSPPHQRMPDVAPHRASALNKHVKPGGRSPSSAHQALLWRQQLGRTTTAIGDSIMIDMQPYLPDFLPGIWVDGYVGRQMISLPQAVAELKAHGKLRKRLIIELGTNGPFDESDLVTFLKSLHEQEIILANTRVPRPWQDEVNAMLAQVARQVPHTFLVNWYAQSANHNAYFYPDGVHLNPVGARVYASLLAHAVMQHADA